MSTTTTDTTTTEKVQTIRELAWALDPTPDTKKTIETLRSTITELMTLTTTPTTTPTATGTRR